MRLIDADTLKRYITTQMDMQDLYLPVHFETLIDEQPTIDAVEVVHGEWTTKRTWEHDGETYCSVCGHDGTVVWNYCPNCGAKMDGRRQNDE